MDLETLRRDAEERSNWLQAQKNERERRLEAPTSPNDDASPLRRRFRSSLPEGENVGEFNVDLNEVGHKHSSTNSGQKRSPSQFANNMHTAEVARLAAVEFRVNGGRARAEIQELVGPRWELDEEVPACRRCDASFDCLNRRHHCRYCGKIFCDSCSRHKVLLPKEFKQPNPQRVCTDCESELKPVQARLAQSMANHRRINYLDLGPGGCRRYMNMPFALTLGSEIRKAAYSLINLFSVEVIKDVHIPIQLLKQAQGLLFITVAKVGFMVGARAGTGLVLSRLPDGTWSAPSAVGLVGATWGFQIGADMTDYVVILNSEDALMPFTSDAQVTLGVEVNVAAGPLGRAATAEASFSPHGLAPAYSYSHSRGLFVGAALEGSLIFPRNGLNMAFYGVPYSPADLLSGRVERPTAGSPLYDALDRTASQSY